MSNLKDKKLEQEGTYSLAHSFLLMGDVHSQLYVGYGLNLFYLKFGETVGGIDPGNSTTYGVNLGALAVLHQRTHIAFAVKNLNNPSMGSDQTFDFPQHLALGIAYEPYDGVITEIDLSQKLGEETKIQAGIEFEVMDNFWLRTGASTYPSSISGGFWHSLQKELRSIMVSVPTLFFRSLISFLLAINF